MSISSVQKTPPTPPPALAPTQTQPPGKNDGDSDDGGGAVRASVEKGVGELLDKTA